jgi:hypothetical protein
MFREFYCWLCDLLDRIKINDNQEFNAYIGISFFQCVNILTIAVFVNYLFNFCLNRNTIIYSGIFIYVSIALVNYFYLFNKKDEIIMRFEKLPIKRKFRGRLYFWLYIIATIALFVYAIENFVVPKQ